MQRRSVLAAVLLPVLASARAQADEPVVKAPRIVERLRVGKDIVADYPGVPAPRPTIDLQVYFVFGSAQLMPAGKRQLDELTMALNDRELHMAAFELAGHTDDVGSHAANMRLSLHRAEAVRTYLVRVQGLSPSRLYPIGFGSTRLADPSRPEAALNRRVEVRRMPDWPRPPRGR
jgi:outer membrane protein OmpA-like peptidoglycan-associated protein